VVHRVLINGSRICPESDLELLRGPVDLLFLPDGSMLLSDDQNGIIYRISYSSPMERGLDG